MAIGSLGDIVFEVNCSDEEIKVFTFSHMRRSVKMRTAKHEVVGAKPITEVIGPDLDELKFRLRLSASLGISPLKAAQKIYQAFNKSTPLRLMLGGYVIGSSIPGCDKWIITDFEEAYQAIDNKGCVWELEMDISLQGYVETIGAGASASSASSASETSSSQAGESSDTSEAAGDGGITGEGDGGENPTDEGGEAEE